MKMKNAGYVALVVAAIGAVAGVTGGAALADGVSPRGLLCSAEGRGVWGGKDVALRFQSSLLSPTSTSASAEVTLYADETTAAIFPLQARGGNALPAYFGVSENNADVRIEARIGVDLSFTVTLVDWKNNATVARGYCDKN